ncbi:MAG: hypothetical protein DHS20C10_11050 [marine bacterium B5-7]|nr:MAG: hypothetical protein DHS20C10_11050 [marine bacterium B5-7]
MPLADENQDPIFGPNADNILDAIAPSVLVACAALHEAGKVDAEYNKFYRYRPGEERLMSGSWVDSQKAYVHIVEPELNMDTCKIPFSIIFVDNKFYAILNSKMDPSLKERQGEFSQFKPLRELEITPDFTSVTWSRRCDTSMKVAKTLEALLPGDENEDSNSLAYQKAVKKNNEAGKQLKNEETVWTRLGEYARFFTTKHASVSGVRTKPPKKRVLVPWKSGDKLTEWIRGAEEMSLQDFFMLAESLLISVHRLHAAGIIHRDIKPDNIQISYVNRLDAEIIDFGLSIDTREALSEALSSKKIAGTVNYLPPEYVRTIPNTEEAPLGYEHVPRFDGKNHKLFVRDLNVEPSILPYSTGMDLYAIGKCLKGAIESCCDISMSKDDCNDGCEVSSAKNLIKGLMHADPNQRMKVEDALLLVSEQLDDKSDDDASDDGVFTTLQRRHTI